MFHYQGGLDLCPGCPTGPGTQPSLCRGDNTLPAIVPALYLWDRAGTMHAPAITPAWTDAALVLHPSDQTWLTLALQLILDPSACHGP